MRDLSQYIFSDFRLAHPNVRRCQLSDLTLAVLLRYADIAARYSGCETHHSAHIFEIVKLACELKLDIIGKSVASVDDLEQLE